MIFPHPDRSVAIPKWAQKVTLREAVEELVYESDETEVVLEALTDQTLPDAYGPKPVPLSWFWRRLPPDVRAAIARAYERRATAARQAMVVAVFQLPFEVEVDQPLTLLEVAKQRVLQFVAEGGPREQIEASVRFVIAHFARTATEVTARDFAELQGYADGVLAALRMLIQ
jgi:hypothetical protein